MTPNQATELLTMLMGCYDKQVQQTTIQAYMVYILHYDYEIARRVILELPLTEERFPKVSSIYQRMKNATSSEKRRSNTRMMIERMREEYGDDEILRGLPGKDAIDQGVIMMAGRMIEREREGRLTEIEQIEANASKISALIEKAARQMSIPGGKLASLTR